MAPKASAGEKILIIEGHAASAQSLRELFASAGYEVWSAASAEEGFRALRNASVDLVLLDAHLPKPACSEALAEIKGSAATSSVRVMLLCAPDAPERIHGLDLGADDVVTRPWETGELLARVRSQLRVKRELQALREKTRIAEEGQEIAHTAFQALAVTEKMTQDAFSLDRRLKIGVTVLFVIALVIAGFYALFSRRAARENNRAYAMIAKLEKGVSKEQNLLAQAHKMREEVERAAVASEEKQRLLKESEDLRQRIEGAESTDVAALRQQLNATNVRLRRIEGERRNAEAIIRSATPSVCLLHVAVAFRDKESGQHLRYAGVTPQGQPLQDSDGNPVYSLAGRGPEVRADFFGTGFLAGSSGRILTNRHVAEPWWKNEDLESAAQQGIEPVIAEITAYFPDSPRPYRVEVAKVSQEADLALMQGDLGELNRKALALDGRKEAAVSGQPLVSVGYATGLAAILARAGEDTVQTIIAATNGSPKQVMAELARRNLIRPLTTQGHIGDVSADKIVYDAQTTSGGSGGPLFNQDGKIVGVTYAVLRGFGGSNFGIPIHYAMPLLRP